MTGWGPILVSVSIIAGGLVGHLTGRLFRAEQQEALNKACGVSVYSSELPGPWKECFLSMVGKSAVESPCWWCFAWLLELL